MPYSEPLLLLLSRKKELVFQLLRMANDTEFNETNSETAEKFINFVEAREEIINSLKALDNEINQLHEANSNLGESSPFERDIREMTAQIARLEMEINKKSLGILEYLQKEIKDLNNRKRASSAYELRQISN